MFVYFQEIMDVPFSDYFVLSCVLLPKRREKRKHFSVCGNFVGCFSVFFFRFRLENFNIYIDIYIYSLLPRRKKIVSGPKVKFEKRVYFYFVPCFLPSFFFFLFTKNGNESTKHDGKCGLDCELQVTAVCHIW